MPSTIDVKPLAPEASASGGPIAPQEDNAGASLSHGPRHGYGIASFIGDSSKGCFAFSTGRCVPRCIGSSGADLSPPRGGFRTAGAAPEECRRWHQYSNGVASVMVATIKSSATDLEEAKETDDGWRRVGPSESTGD